jgi:hypothetical protein
MDGLGNMTQEDRDLDQDKKIEAVRVAMSEASSRIDALHDRNESERSRCPLYVAPACCYICVLILPEASSRIDALHDRNGSERSRCPHTTVYVSLYSSYYYIYSARMLLYMCPLILLETSSRIDALHGRNESEHSRFPHTTVHVSSYYFYMCHHTTVLVSSYYFYMCHHTTVLVSSYYCICVLILVYI